MRLRLLPVLLLLGTALAEDPFHRVALLNVEIVDSAGVAVKLTGFHRISGEDKFRGFLGSGEIEVPYARVREWRVMGPAHPGGRPRCRLTLRSGQEVEAAFDEREGEQLFTGFASFGKVSLFFRDLRELRIVGKTRRSDLPKYGPPAVGADVKLTDRHGVTTELTGFRRATGENVVPGVRGAARVMIPLRLLAKLEIAAADQTPYLDAVARLRDAQELRFKLPIYEEETVYRGNAAFGVYRIRLGKIRAIEVHRITPLVRALDPIAAAEGQEKPEGSSPR